MKNLKLFLLIVFVLSSKTYALSLAEQKELVCLTEVIYYEARGTSVKSQYMVGAVVLNRLGKTHAKTICGVVYAPSRNPNRPLACQFSWTCDKHIKPADKKSKAWVLAKKIALCLIKEKKALLDLSYGAQYYTQCKVKRVWQKAMVLVATEANHCFYRDNKEAKLQLAKNSKNQIHRFKT
jgi:spore germination cell wall hydrolase CwlJ-like protein